MGEQLSFLHLAAPPPIKPRAYVSPRQYEILRTLQHTPCTLSCLCAHMQRAYYRLSANVIATDLYALRDRGLVKVKVIERDDSWWVSWQPMLDVEWVIGEERAEDVKISVEVKSEGERLKLLRLMAGIPQFKVAGVANMSPSVLTRIERGERPVSAEEARVIEEAIRSL